MICEDQDVIQNLFLLNLSNSTCDDVDCSSRNKTFIEKHLPWIMKNDRWEDIFICQPAGFSEGISYCSVFHNLQSLIDKIDFKTNDLEWKILGRVYLLDNLLILYVQPFYLFFSCFI